MRCPGPGFCPYADPRRFYVMVGLVATLLVAMSAIAFAAIVKGKDGVITTAACGSMSAAVTAVLLGGLRMHRPKSPK